MKPTALSIINENNGMRTTTDALSLKDFTRGDFWLLLYEQGAYIFDRCEKIWFTPFVTKTKSTDSHKIPENSFKTYQNSPIAGIHLRLEITLWCLNILYNHKWPFNLNHIRIFLTFSCRCINVACGTFSQSSKSFELITATSILAFFWAFWRVK